MSAFAFLNRRAALIDSPDTDSFRLINGASDSHPALYVDKLGSFLLAQSEQALSAERQSLLEETASRLNCSGVYFKNLDRHIRQRSPEDAKPRHLAGSTVPDTFPLRENGITYEASFNEGYSVGLFLDQRENRRAWMNSDLAQKQPKSPPRLLNCFAYTCAFSVAAAMGGWETTSLDLSRKYLDWGRRNFEANGLDPTNHDFIYGDAFEWLKRLAKKGRTFEAVVLDPPTFSKARNGTQFKADRDYGALVKNALSVLSHHGTLFVSTNAAKYPKPAFLADIEAAIAAEGRSIAKKRFVPQPSDFPTTPDEPAYLKTCWYRTE